MRRRSGIQSSVCVRVVTVPHIMVSLLMQSALLVSRAFFRTRTGFGARVVGSFAVTQRLRMCTGPCSRRSSV
jgi:hypothetical protein